MNVEPEGRHKTGESLFEIFDAKNYSTIQYGTEQGGKEFKLEFKCRMKK